MLSIHSSYVSNRLSQTVAHAQGSAQKHAARLASGKRLISAADDSAGKAVEVNLEARIRSRKVAQRNTEYGKLMCETALGGLNTIQESVVRLQSLAVQAANDSLTDRERAYLQTEVNQVLTGIDDVAFQTRLHEDQPLLSKVPIDIGFLIDRSGSMADEIEAVKSQIDSFFDDVVSKGFNVAFGLGTAGGNDNLDATVRNADIGSPDFKAQLNAMSANQPMPMEHYSTLINAGVTDHPGTVDPDLFSWRGGSKKYLILVTDTRAQETGGLLPGNPSQSEVAAQLESAGVTVHVIGNLSRAADYTTITSQTGGSYSTIFPDQPGETVADAMDQALASIETEIESQVDAVKEYVLQTGIHADADDRVETDVALDASRLGLQLEELDIGTRDDAVQSLDQLSIAFDNLNKAFTTYATLQNKLERLSDNTAIMIQSESASLGTIKDADFADSSTELAISQVQNENSVNVLRVYNEMKTSLVNNLLNAVRGSVQGGLYAGYV